MKYLHSEVNKLSENKTSGYFLLLILDLCKTLEFQGVKLEQTIDMDILNSYY